MTPASPRLVHRASVPAILLGCVSGLVSGSAGAVSYVTTDQATLDALSVAGTTPPVNYATYVSGGSEAVGYSNACDFGYFMEAGSSADSLTSADLSWTQSGAQGILFQLPYPSVTVVVFPSIDHGPFPNEGIEYTVWGSETGDLGAFPTGWDTATLVSIYREGWVDSCPGNAPGEESDDFAGLYGFRDNLLNYVLVLPSGSITIYEDTSYTTWIAEGDDGSEAGWQSSDFEIDAVGVPDCAGGVVAVGLDASGVLGEPITLDGSGSLGTIANYGWDLDQDFAVDLSGSVVQHTFGTAGEYDVQLSVVGEDGCSDFDTVGVSVCGLEDADSDLDGFRDEDCGGDDCEDADAGVYPGAPETSDDGRDQDCDGHDDVTPPADDDTTATSDDDTTPAGDDDSTAAGGPPAPQGDDFEGGCSCQAGRPAGDRAGAVTAGWLVVSAFAVRRRAGGRRTFRAERRPSPQAAPRPRGSGSR